MVDVLLYTKRKSFTSLDKEQKGMVTVTDRETGGSQSKQVR